MTREAIEEAKAALAEILKCADYVQSSANTIEMEIRAGELVRFVKSHASRALAALSKPTKGMSTEEIDQGMMSEASLSDACAKVDWPYYGQAVSGVTEEERAIDQLEAALRFAHESNADQDFVDVDSYLRKARELLPTLRAQSVPEGELDRLKSIANISELLVNDYQANNADGYQAWLEVLIACFLPTPPRPEAEP